MIIALGFIAIDLIAGIQTIVEAIAQMMITIAANGLAITLSRTTFMFAGKLIRVVAAGA